MDALKWQVSTDTKHLILTKRNYRPSSIAIREGGKKALFRGFLEVLWLQAHWRESGQSEITLC